MTSSASRRGFNAALLTSAACAIAAPAVIGKARAQEVRLVLSHHVPTTHIIQPTSERFAALVTEATKGQITVDIRPASQLFNLRTAPEAMQLGTLDLGWSDCATLGNWQPEFGFISMPFLFNGYDHVKRVLQGPLGQQVGQDVKNGLGIEALALGASGFRVFCGKRAIRTADDCKGMKLRVPEIQTWVEMARSLGANPTPIPAAEIYTALQTGVVDGIEIAGRLHHLVQDLRGGAARDPHPPHLHRGLAVRQRPAHRGPDAGAADRDPRGRASGGPGRDVGRQPEAAGGVLERPRQPGRRHHRPRHRELPRARRSR